MADADIAQGVVLSRAGAAVGSVTNISGPSVTQETVDITDLDSTWREHKGVLMNGGEVTFTVNYLFDNAVHQNVRGDMSAHTSSAWTLQYTDATTITASFNALVTAFSTEAAVGGVVTANLTLLVNGAVTWA
jgi:predicted secreted protein